MQKTLSWAIAFTFVFMCFTGCLGDNEDDTPNRAPEARILKPGQGNTFEVGEFFTIDGSLSSDPDDDDLQYMWTLSGLGSPIDLSTQMSDSVMVDMPGDDLVLTLMVKDSGGLTSQDIVVINIEPGNRPPVASIITPSNGGSYSKGKEVTFNGMSSNDADNDPLTYVWELGEAGEPTYKASTESKFSLDLGEGDWSVTLTVTDPDGESNFVKHSFSVTDLPPVASIKLDKTSVFTDEIIQFSGEDSYDPEGEALDFLWDFGDNKTSSLKSPQHSWDNAGMYQVTLTVIAEDQEGAETKNIEIKSLGPIAEFEFEDESGSEVEKTRSNANITLDGGDSSGPDGEIKEYRWNFGDGMERTTNESSTEYSWSAGGYYNVTLTVTDENDETGEIVKILQVVPEDYSEEGQDSSPVAQDIEQNYNFNVEIFVSSMEIEFTEISCIGAVGSSLDYTLTIADSTGNEVGSSNGNIACGGEAASWNLAINSEDNPIQLGDYQANIAFTNSGTPVQASWNYKFVVIYEF